MLHMPQQPKRPSYEINEGRFKRRLAYIASDDDCWIWGSTFHKRRLASGKIYRIPVMPYRLANGAETTVYARRYAWEMRYGFVPEGHHLVNVCGEDACVKPDPKHNRPVAPGEAIHEKRAAGLDVSTRPKPVNPPTSEEEFLTGNNLTSRDKK